MTILRNVAATMHLELWRMPLEGYHAVPYICKTLFYLYYITIHVSLCDSGDKIKIGKIVLVDTTTFRP